MNDADWPAIEQRMSEVLEGQWNKLERIAKDIVPEVTRDDLWQPNDFPELENHPNFRYEEGIVAGMQALQMSLQALKKGD